MNRKLITGGTVVSMDPAIGTGALDVLIEGDVITRVAPDIQAEEAEIIDASQAIVSPGFVDTHRHIWQTQLRSVATDWSLFDYFVQMRSVYSGFYAPEDAYLGNYVGVLEALNAGITTIVDHCHILNSPDHSDRVVDGLDQAGARTVWCYGTFGNPSHWNPDLQLPDGWRVEDAKRLAQRLEPHALISFGFAPAEVTAMPFDAACAEIELARSLSAHRISCHVSMGKYDNGAEFVRRLGDAGLLAEDLLFVHGSSLTDQELELIVNHGCAISATPETELQMAMGHPVAVRAQDKGARVSLGVDIVSNYSGDMQAQMRLLLQAQRGLENEQLTGPPAKIRFKAEDVLRMATIGGAESLGWSEQIGSLSPGKQADVVITRCDAINMVPSIDPVGMLVLNANPSNVSTVLVAGDYRKRDGVLVGVDWADLADRLRESSARIKAGFDQTDVAAIEQAARGMMLNG